VRWQIRKRRAGGGGGQAGDVDIVLHRNGNAVQRKLRGIFCGQGFHLRQRIFFFTQADEDGWIVMIANPLKTPRHGLRGRHGASAVRGNNSSDRFSHALPRSGKNVGAARSVFRMRNGKDELSSPLLTALRETEILHQSTQAVCHCVHRIAGPVYENRHVLSSA
jgi:hypothetical protein